MKIDDLFINDNKSASEELKTSEDSLVEPLAKNIEELKSTQYDALMAININCKSFNIDSLQQKASTFRRLVLSQLNGIEKCSKILVGNGFFNLIDNINGKCVKEYNYVVIAFKKNFTSARQIIKLMNASWGYFSFGNYCYFNFIMNGYEYYDSKYLYDYSQRELYLNRKKENCSDELLKYIRGQYVRLVYMLYSLLPDNIGIKPYKQLCNYYNLSLFETDVINFLSFSKHSLIDCKIGEGYLKNFDGIVLIDRICPECTTDVKLNVMSPKYLSTVRSLQIVLDLVIRNAYDIRYFMRHMKNGLEMNQEIQFDRGMIPFVFTDSVTIRQFSIYLDLTTDKYNSIKFILVFRLDPIYTNRRPSEVVFTKEIKIDMPYHGSYGTIVASELSNMLQLRFPDSFINEFDKQFDIISEQQLKNRYVRYHDREH